MVQMEEIQRENRWDSLVNYGMSAWLDSVRDATALDDHTVRIDLKQVYFRNTWMLGGFEILPRHHYDPDDLLAGLTVAQLNDWEALSPAEQERAERGGGGEHHDDGAHER